MKQYFKEKIDYYRWYCNHNDEYFIYELSDTRNNTLCVEYYPIRYNNKINQYSMSNLFLKKWNNIIDIQKELNINPDEILEACKRPFGTAYGCKWEIVREGDTNETSTIKL